MHQQSASDEPAAAAGDPGGGLHLDLHAQLDDAVGGKPEKPGRTDGVLREEREQLLAPGGHPFPARHDDGLAPQEIGDVLGVDVEPL